MIGRILYVGTESDRIIKELSKLPELPEGWEPRKTGLDAHIDSQGPSQSTL